MPCRPYDLVFGAVLIWSLVVGFDILHSTGEVGTTEKNGSGCVCHDFSPSASVGVWIEGPDSVLAGSSTVYQVVMTGGPAVAGGYNVAAAHGSLATTDAESQLMDPGAGQSFELTQTAPKTFTNDTVRWSFLYHAPAAAGVETLFSVGNSVDLSHNPNGDLWNFGTLKRVAVRPDTATGVVEASWPSSALLLRCYPNPFNPRTRLVFSTGAAGHARIVLFSVSGQQVATLVDGRVEQGEHSVDWDAADAASGVYLARLETGQGAVTQKLLLVR